MDDQPYDVVVVGLGPVGAALTNLLAKDGNNWRILVVEQTDNADLKPKAAGIDGESLRTTLQRIGVLHEFERKSRYAPRIHFVFGWGYTTEKGRSQDHAIESIQGLTSNAGTHGDFYDPGYIQCAQQMHEIHSLPKIMVFFQPELERIMQSKLKERANVNILLGTSCLSIAETKDDDGLTSVKIKKNQGTWVKTVSGEMRWQIPHDGASEDDAIVVRSKFVIGCDGASSVVRKYINDYKRIEPQIDYRAKWLVVDICLLDFTKLGKTIPIEAQIVCGHSRQYVIVPGVWVRLESGQSGRHVRFDIRINPSDPQINHELEHPDFVQSVIRHWIPDKSDYYLIRAAAYESFAMVSPKWRRQNVFVAGDSAHVMPFLMGQGINSGLRDVSSLWWRICFALKGVGMPDEYLDAYERDRLPAVQKVTSASCGIGNMMDYFSSVESVLVETVTDGNNSTINPKAYLRDAVEQFFKSKPPAPPREVLTAGISQFYQSARRHDHCAGTAFPQFLISTANGDKLLSDEVIFNRSSSPRLKAIFWDPQPCRSDEPIQSAARLSPLLESELEKLYAEAFYLTMSAFCNDFYRVPDLLRSCRGHQRFFLVLPDGMIIGSALLEDQKDLQSVLDLAAKEYSGGATLKFDDVPQDNICMARI